MGAGGKTAGMDLEVQMFGAPFALWALAAYGAGWSKVANTQLSAVGCIRPVVPRRKIAGISAVLRGW